MKTMDIAIGLIKELSMNKKDCKVIGVIVFAVVIICSIAYAGQHSKDDTLPSAAMTTVERMYPNHTAHQFAAISAAPGTASFPHE